MLSFSNWCITFSIGSLSETYAGGETISWETLNLWYSSGRNMMLRISSRLMRPTILPLESNTGKMLRLDFEIAFMTSLSTCLDGGSASPSQSHFQFSRG